MVGILSFCVSVGNNYLFICQTSFSILAMCRQVLRKVWGYWELREYIKRKEYQYNVIILFRGMPVMKLGQKRSI